MEFGESFQFDSFVDNISDEILLKVFSMLDIEDLIRCTQVSKRFYRIANDSFLWNAVNVSGKAVPYKFLVRILSLGTMYLNVGNGVTYSGCRCQKLPSENRLKYLDGSWNMGDPTDINVEVYVELLNSCTKLEKLAISDAFNGRKRLHKRIVEGIVKNSSTLKALRFDSLEMPRKYFDPVMTSCINLTELWLVNVNQPPKSVEKICNNMASSLQKLIIQHAMVTNVAIENIVTRCPNLFELELYELCAEPTLPNGNDDPEVLNKMIMQISVSLQKLRRFSTSGPELGIINVMHLGAMPSLQELYIFNDHFSELIMEKLKTKFPKLNIFTAANYDDKLELQFLDEEYSTKNIFDVQADRRRFDLFPESETCDEPSENSDEDPADWDDSD